MDFSWSDKQLALKDRIIQFAKQTLNEDVIERDKQGLFSRTNWQKCADFGIQGLYIPEAYSGNPEVDLLTAVLAMEAMGYGCQDNGLNLALNAQMWTVQLPILHFGTEAQKKRFLPPLCNGKWIGVHGLTEPDSGSDTFSLKTVAKKHGDGYILNGSKQLITCAPIADLAMVFATIDPSLGRWGVTVFLVEKGTPGFTVSPVRDKMGLRTVPIGELYFQVDNLFIFDIV